MHKYTAHDKRFNKIAKKVYPIMENITQRGFLECDSTGHAYLAMHRPNFGRAFIQKKIYL